MLYISWFEHDPTTGETTQRKKGPFWSLSPDGSGAAINQAWTCYKATNENGDTERITIPSKYHTIMSN